MTIDDPDAEVVEILASTAHTVFMRADRWNAQKQDGTPMTSERNKVPWRLEARAQLGELRRRGYEIFAASPGIAPQGPAAQSNARQQGKEP